MAAFARFIAGTDTLARRVYQEALSRMAKPTHGLPAVATHSWCDGKVLGFFLRLHAVLFGLLAFGVYWVVPLLASALDRTWISHQGLHALPSLLRHVPGAHAALAWSTPPIHTPLQLGYLEDVNHLAFSIGLALGAMMVPMILRRINSTSRRLIEESVTRDVSWVRSTYAKYRAWANHRVVRVIAAALAAVIAARFTGFYLGPEYAHWWGSSVSGHAGLVLIAVEFVMVYFGSQAILHIALGAIVVGKLVGQNIEPRPFHPDGCGGLAPVGGLIVMLWIFAICLAAEVLVTLKLGYLGIEESAATWMLAFLSVCCLPCLAIYPLFCCVKTLHAARLRELRQLEPSIVSLYQETMRLVAMKAYDDAAHRADQTGKLAELYNHLLEQNIWPFNRRAICLVVLIYTIQFGLTMRELFGTL